MGLFLFQMCVRTNYHTTTASSSETCPLWLLCLAEQARREHSVRHPASSVVVSTKRFPAVFSVTGNIFQDLQKSMKMPFASFSICIQSWVCFFIFRILHHCFSRPDFAHQLCGGKCWTCWGTLQDSVLRERNFEEVQSVDREKKWKDRERRAPTHFRCTSFCWLLLGISNLEKKLSTPQAKSHAEKERILKFRVCSLYNR